MYSVTVKSYFFMAHSLKHPGFGIAQNTHGATLNVEVTVYSSNLNEMNIVIDISILKDSLNKIIERYNYKNLDDIKEFDGKITTIDFLSNHFYHQIKKELANREITLGNAGISKMKVIIYESNDAWASYENDF